MQEAYGVYFNDTTIFDARQSWHWDWFHIHFQDGHHYFSIGLMGISENEIWKFRQKNEINHRGRLEIEES